MLAKLKEGFLGFFFGSVCPNCGIRSHRAYGNYARAWNHLCQQAAGTMGFYCYNCRHIEFKDTYEAWLAKQPKWIGVCTDKSKDPYRE